MSSLRAKKSLGQHFLRSKTALAEIVAAANLSGEETVLEVGSGEGVLTRALLASGARVIAVETDPRCIEILIEEFKEESVQERFILIHGDIREEDVQKKLFEKKALGARPYKLIANIPYYITGMLFRLFLEILRQPTDIVFLIQKEVADEILSRDGKEGILSLAVKAYGTPRYIAKVKREAFTPPPKVDSTILAIRDISRTRLPRTQEKNYFRIVKAGLGSRRKMLFGNLVRVLPKERGAIEDAFTTLGIAREIRGEDLSAEKWLLLAAKLSERTEGETS